MLRDKLVCGLGDGSIQRRLLQQKNLTLDTATELALQTEAATKELQLLRQESTPSDAVNKEQSLHRSLLPGNPFPTLQVLRVIVVGRRRTNRRVAHSEIRIVSTARNGDTLKLFVVAS